MKRYKIAGLYVDMDVKYNRLLTQGKPYEVENDGTPPNMSFTLSEKVMEKARVKFSNLTDEEIEYILYGFLFSDGLLDYSGIMIHASAVGLGGYAYLFSADSGVGKSTHTSFYLELFKEKAVIINDDKPVLRKIGNKIFVYGTPFSGKHDLSKNAAYELGGICFLSRGEENVIQKITPAEAIGYIYKQTQSGIEKDRVEKRLTALDFVLSQSPLYKMKCINHISAAEVSYSAMKRSIPFYLEELSDLMLSELEKGKKVKFCTKGTSMSPLLISGRDSVVLKKAKEFKKNDIVLFKNNDGKYILHRIKIINGEQIITKGDAVLECDAPITKENIIAKAVAFVRKGKEISVTSLWYILYVFAYTTKLGKIILKIKRRFF